MQCRQEQCRGLNAGRANGFECAESVEVGNQPVKNEHRIIVARRKEDRVASGGADLDDMTRRAEQARNVIAHFPIIYEQKEFHAAQAMGECAFCASWQFPILT